MRGRDEMEVKGEGSMLPPLLFPSRGGVGKKVIKRCIFFVMLPHTLKVKREGKGGGNLPPPHFFCASLRNACNFSRRSSISAKDPPPSVEDGGAEGAAAGAGAAAVGADSTGFTPSKPVKFGWAFQA